MTFDSPEWINFPEHLKDIERPLNRSSKVPVCGSCTEYGQILLCELRYFFGGILSSCRFEFTSSLLGIWLWWNGKYPNNQNVVWRTIHSETLNILFQYLHRKTDENIRKNLNFECPENCKNWCRLLTFNIFYNFIYFFYTWIYLKSFTI